MDRRRFLKVTTALQAAVVGTSGCATHPAETMPTQTGLEISAEQATSFQHGVASGDPLTDRVILWTRVSPLAEITPSVDVEWWIGPTAERADALYSGTVVAQAERDYTVKVDAAGLTPDTRYFYGFSDGNSDSPLGQTRTLPVGEVDSVKLAVTSCANYPQGYFNAYRSIAETEDLHAVLSLGDYLYEYANAEYGDGNALDRVPVPNREIVSLADYRARHAQYKTDPDLQAAHQAHPWIVIWDDHESANNSWSGGAQNHNPELGEGSWEERRANAIMAYYEWMPIREVPTGLFRSFRFGNLADLVMLDTRLAGRDEQGTRDDFELATDPQRTLLGPIQEGLFLNHLSASEADQVRWKLVGQQVVFAPWTDGQSPFNADSWEGYRSARARVLDHIEQGDIQNVVILSGDVHSSWGMEVPNVKGDRSQAIELVAPAVSSPPLATLSQSLHDMVRRAPTELQHIKYAEGHQNGYLVVAVDHQEARARWHFTGDRTVRGSASTGAGLVCRAGTNRLEPAS